MTPGPLDNLPRPLDERDGRGRGWRQLGAVVLAAIVVSVGFAAATSLASGPPTPVGAVQGAVGSPSTRVQTSPPVVASPATVTPKPKPTPAPIPTPAAPATLTGYRSPLPHGRLTLPFGPSPWGSRLVDGSKFHDGIDLATFCGDRVVAAHAGTVLAAGRKYDRYMGWIGDLQPYLDRLQKKHLWSTLPLVVVIDDGNGFRSLYAHFGKIVVAKGDVVAAGQPLGYEGMTGRASGCHLHYGIFSPLETATFGIDPDVVERMKVPDREIARIDPLLVLPGHATPSPSSSTGASPPSRDEPTGSPDSP